VALLCGEIRPLLFTLCIRILEVFFFIPKYNNLSSFALTVVKYIQVEVCRPLIQVGIYLLFCISHQARNPHLLEVCSDLSTALFYLSIIRSFYFHF